MTRKGKRTRKSRFKKTVKRIFRKNKKLIISLVALILLLGISLIFGDQIFKDRGTNDHIPNATLDSIPEFDGENAYVIINNNVPFFTDEEKVTESYEKYGDLDGLGRCTVCIACVGIDIMPTEERESISSVKPSGWINAEYDFIPGGYLYNRCHLIGFQLTGENANKQNLITGTKYLNIEGMLPFENQIADYVKETENHVMLRVTPIYEGDNLVASGVLLEAWSVEDEGDGICFCIYAYNNQPGVIIDYSTGESRAEK